MERLSSDEGRDTSNYTAERILVSPSEFADGTIGPLTVAMAEVQLLELLESGLTEEGHTRIIKILVALDQISIYLSSITGRTELSKMRQDDLGNSLFEFDNTKKE